MSEHYPGNKHVEGVWQRIINLMPPHRVYFEPFGGGAAVLRLKKPAAVNIAIDIDPEAIATARRLLADRLDETGEPTRSARPGTPKPAMVAGKRRPRATSVSARAAALASAGDGGPQYALLDGDGIEFLEQYPFAGDEVVYCDPPYLRKNRRRRFRHELDEGGHGRLLDAAVKVEAKTKLIISGYWSDLYAERLKHWNHITFKAMTHGGVRNEILWFNFAVPAVLHDYRHLGKDFRERERIRRLIKRWVVKLRARPAIERQAMLAALSEVM